MAQLGPRDPCPDCGNIRGYFHDLPGQCRAQRPVMSTSSVVQIDPARASRYATKALRSEAENVAAAPNGTRNHTLNKAAFNLSQLVAAGHLSEDDVRSTLVDAAHSAGLDEDEIEPTIASGFKAGAEQPRIVPDLPDTPVTVLDDHAAQALADGADPAAPPIAPILDWRTLWTEDHTQEWVLEPILPARRMVALYSPPKAGKSLLMLEIAVAIALGREALGRVPDRPQRVLYVDFENDPAGDVLTRLVEMGYTADDLYDEDGTTNLCYLSYPSLAKFDTPTGAADLLRHIHHYDCEVVVIDTLSRAVMGEENSNDTWLAFYRHTGLALKQAQVSCIRLDHTGKDTSKGMRGGSAKYGDVDAVWSLTLDEDTEVVTLECTDKRLPITETRIDLRRERDPLRHVVDTAAWKAKLQPIITDLDDIGYPSHESANGAIQALKDAGRGRRAAEVRKAQMERNRRPYVLPE
jgi:hypothetical protein